MSRTSRSLSEEKARRKACWGPMRSAIRAQGPEGRWMRTHHAPVGVGEGLEEEGLSAGDEGWLTLERDPLVREDREGV